ncbi:hypothetical protein GCM10009789_04840 [Kribbella sancticallisti]|uniref:Uncharacterized protein n=1 Tax=Kribbella sancticallisti TaxID=460087 RepID=A0ABN2C9S8_9ACTN
MPSDSRAKADERTGFPRSACAQRAAVWAPICGSEPPARTPARINIHTGDDDTVRPISREIAEACSSRVIGSMRGCPNLSISRATCGPPTASAMAKPPVTLPATAYEPVEPCTSQTMPRPVIAMPIRAGAAAR